MAIGESKYVNTLFQFIDDQSKTDIENFILNSLMKNYEEFTDSNYVQALLLRLMIYLKKNYCL